MSTVGKSGIVLPTKLFVGGLSYDTTDSSLSRYFEKFGDLVSAVVLRDPASLRSRGFGFVTFVSAQAAKTVLAQETHIVDGRKVEPKLAIPRGAGSTSNNNNINSGTVLSGSQVLGTHSFSSGASNSSVASTLSSSGAAGSRYSSHALSYDAIAETEEVLPASRRSKPLVPNKIFVGGLLYATGRDSLRKYFEVYGIVEKAEVIYNRDTKKSRGFGFVVFREFAAVDAVLKQQSSKRLVIDGKQVEVKPCIPRHDLPEYGETRSNLLTQPRENPIAGEQLRGGDVRAQVNSGPPLVNKWHQKPFVTSLAESTLQDDRSPNNLDVPVVQHGFTNPGISSQFVDTHFSMDEPTYQQYLTSIGTWNHSETQENTWGGDSSDYDLSSTLSGLSLGDVNNQTESSGAQYPANPSSSRNRLLAPSEKDVSSDNVSNAGMLFGQGFDYSIFGLLESKDQFAPYSND